MEKCVPVPRLEMLDDLQKQKEAVDDFPPIKKSRPENADEQETGDLMVQTNLENAMEVAKSVLMMRKKGSCRLTIDTNTVNRELKLCDDNRKVTRVEEYQSYPDHPDRFDWYQLLCRDGLTGCCYWEVEWRGDVDLSVSYRRIRRKGELRDISDCLFGCNDQSWTLECSDDGPRCVWHNKKRTLVSSSSSSSSGSNRVAVYVDCPAGTLSFYRVSDTLFHLHTFNTTFTEPLYPGFRLGYRYTGHQFSGASVSLC